jgi:hypothetical protein
MESMKKAATCEDLCAAVKAGYRLAESGYHIALPGIAKPVGSF